MKNLLGVIVIGIFLIASSSATTYQDCEIYGTCQDFSEVLTTFLNLYDTPSTYTGSGTQCIKVNAGETALEFGACGDGDSNFSATDFQSSFDANFTGTGLDYNQTDTIFFYNQTDTIFFYNQTDTIFFYNQTDTVYFYNQTDTVYFYNQTTISPSLGYNMTTISPSLGYNMTQNNFQNLSVVGNVTVGGNFSVGAADFWVDPDLGRVGIGTASPGALLHVSSIGSTTTALFSGGNPASVGNQQNSVYFRTNNDLNSAANELFFQHYHNGSNLGTASIITTYWDTPGFKFTLPRDLTTRGFQFTNQAGTPLMYIVHDGNVGIGTTTPDALLEVEGDMHVQDTMAAGINYNLVVNGDDSGTDGEAAGIFLGAINNTFRGAFIAAERQSASNDHDLIFGTSSASATPVERMRIDEDGNVGIGTASPSDQLSLSGDGTWDFNLASVDTISRGVDPTDDGLLSVDGELLFQTDNNNNQEGAFRFFNGIEGEIMRISENGKVGIGTAAPGESLEVIGNIEASGNVTVSGVTGGALKFSNGLTSAPVNNALPHIYRTGTSAGSYPFNAYGNLVYQPRTTGDLDHVFMVSDDGSSTDVAMVIAHDGNVGIGTTSPSDQLSLSGDGTWDFNLASVDTISRGGSATDDGLLSVDGELLFQTDNNNNQEGAFRFFNGIEGEIMRISENGKVGIGTTIPTFPLTVVGNVSDGSNLVSIWVDSNISATGYITRTSIFDKNKNVWDHIKDADYYKTGNEINHSSFYGYVTYPVTDFTIPVNESYEQEVCEDIFEDVLDEFNETVKEYLRTDCNNETRIRIVYPYNKTESGVELGMEIDVLRQAIFELKEENTLLKAAICALNPTAEVC